MSFISKATQFIEPQKLPNRFTDGWQTMGTKKIAPRTNSAEELINSLKAHAKDNSEIAEFVKNLNNMDKKHLGLAQDIIDLANTNSLLPTNINLKKEVAPNKTILGSILNRLPNLSHKNPEALDLTEQVINNTDNQNSKYFICNLFDFDLERMGNSLAEQMKVVKEMIPTIAEGTLNSGYKMNFEANNNFFQIIKRLCSSDMKPENIKILDKITKLTDECKKTEQIIDVDIIGGGNTSVMTKNLEVLPQVLKNADAQNKTINVSEFLTKNINLD